MGNSPNRNDLTSNNSSPSASSANNSSSSTTTITNQDEPDPLPIQSSSLLSLSKNVNANVQSHVNTPIPYVSSLSASLAAVSLNSSNSNSSDSSNDENCFQKISGTPSTSPSSINSNNNDFQFALDMGLPMDINNVLPPTKSTIDSKLKQPPPKTSHTVPTRTKDVDEINELIGSSSSSSSSPSPSTSPSNAPARSKGKIGTNTKSSTKSKSSSISVDIDSIIEKLVAAGLSKKTPKLFPVSNDEMRFICAKSRKVFMNQPMLLELAAPVKIVGDIHGQFPDLLRIFKLCGFPPSANYLFLGDYVDRGKQSLETMVLLLCLKIKYPENFFLLRGNHESADITKMYGFYDECKRRTLNGVKTWKLFVDVFNTLPVAATIADKIFCVHGGLSPDLKDLNQIKRIQRPTDIPDEGLLADLLWSDPQDIQDTAVNNSRSKDDRESNVPTKMKSRSKFNSDWIQNDRGVSYCFNDNIVKKFCARFDFDLVARGHMVVEEGYEFYAKRRLVTIFSAPNYCGEFKNWGAVMNVNKKLMCSFELLKPKELKK